MKIKIVFLLLFGFQSVFAAPVSEEVHEENCRNLMAMAEAAIKTKQNGVSLGNSLSNLGKMVESGQAQKEETAMMQKILRDAYDEPTYSTPKIKQEQANDFAAKYYLACMEMYE